MASREVRPEPPLIVVVGPTASGKTALAIRLAKEVHGEVVSADSRAIYKGLSIGTAKPTDNEQAGIPHWGIDIVEPNERFTAADFKEYAVAKINDIKSRGIIPILAGGTGLYIDAIVYDFDFTGGADTQIQRAKFESATIEELHDYCYKSNVKLPENKMNKRYVINTILRNGRPPKRKHKLDDNIIVVGIATEKEILRERIARRATTIFASGVIEEATTAASKYGWSCEAMTGNIYPLVRQYVQGDLTRAELEEQFSTKDWQLAKRQLTWFRRNEHIYWGTASELYTYVTRRLDEVNNL